MNYLKNKRFILLLTILTLLSSLSSNVYSSDKKWNLEIRLEKQNYIFHETIWLDITLTNITSDTLRTHGLVSPNYRKFFIELIDEAGKLVEYTGGVFSMVTLPGRLLLNAGEQDYGSFNLPWLFASYEKYSGYSVPKMRFPFIPKGMYTVRVLFEDDISNEQTFNIVEPSGDEKEALELIEKASKIWKKDNTDPSSQIYKEIVERFPNTVFAEECFYLYKFYSPEIWNGLKDGSFDKRIFKRGMLNSYPNSGYSKGWLDAITHDMGDDVISEAEKWEIINKYLRDFPNTRCYKFAKQMQERLFGIENNWGLEIELEKQVYISYEPIWLDIELMNNTSEIIRTSGLLTPNQSIFFIDLKNSSGESVEYTGPAYVLSEHPGRLLLRPGEKNYETRDLLDLFASRKETSGYSISGYRFQYLPKGMYTVQVFYEDDFSNKLTFSILEPSGDEKEALGMVEDAYRIWTQDNSDPSAKLFQKIVDKFPSSVFAEICFFLSRYYSQEMWDGVKDGSYQKKMRILRRDLIENYPNSGNSKGWLLDITHKLDDKEKLEIINKYLKDYPNTRCYKFAKQMQERLLNK